MRKPAAAVLSAAALVGACVTAVAAPASAGVAAASDADAAKIVKICAPSTTAVRFNVTNGTLGGSLDATLKLMTYNPATSAWVQVDAQYHVLAGAKTTFNENKGLAPAASKWRILSITSNGTKYSSVTKKVPTTLPSCS